MLSGLLHCATCGWTMGDQNLPEVGELIDGGKMVKLPEYEVDDALFHHQDD